MNRDDPTAEIAPPPPAPARFRPHERIRASADFRRAFERRKAASDAVLVVHAVENGRDYPRLGVVVGKKKVRKATARNRLKRVVREAFRLSKGVLPTGVDLVVSPRAPGLSLATAQGSLAKLARESARRLGPRQVPTAPPPSGEPAP